MKKSISQNDLIKEFFKSNPNCEIPHQESVDWLTAQYQKRTGKVFRDPDRGIRKLAQSGFLIKLAKGVYKYDPRYEHQRHLEDFTQKQKKQILKRDGYRCVICGTSKESGVELHVDHIKPKELGGKATIENGQTLCAKHNFSKKTLKQTETGKKMFIRLYDLAKKSDDKQTIEFCKDILAIFQKHNINGHIQWEE